MSGDTRTDGARSGRETPPQLQRPRSLVAALRANERGVYAPFIAVITAALLLFGSIAYDGPRLNTVRQHAARQASEAARVAAATIAGGGTADEAEQAAVDRLAQSGHIYGQPTVLVNFDCVGTTVEVLVYIDFYFRSVIGAAANPHRTSAEAAAEAYILLPSQVFDPTAGEGGLKYLTECVIDA